MTDKPPRFVFGIDTESLGPSLGSYIDIKTGKAVNNDKDKTLLGQGLIAAADEIISAKPIKPPREWCCLIDDEGYLTSEKLHSSTEGFQSIRVVAYDDYATATERIADLETSVGLLKHERDELKIRVLTLTDRLKHYEKLMLQGEPADEERARENFIQCRWMWEADKPPFESKEWKIYLSGMNLQQARALVTIDSLQSKLETARSALKDAQETIHDEFCGRTQHHRLCAVHLETLKEL
jgi:hypothetical protein